MTMIGVLAYGSLITDPGPELAAITVAVTKGVLTPFAVEFARRSRKRGGAPTLMPVDVGGCPVRAVIFQVEGNASEVADIVYRREIHAIGSGKTYSEPAAGRTDAVRIAQLEGLAGFDLVLSTWLAINIDPLSAEVLANLAIASAQALDDGRDGISYLIAARKSGIETPLTPHYATCILAKTGTADLADALRAVQEGTVM
jgi:hypothetical protein